MTIELKVPEVGESIQEVQIGQWLKQEGDHVDVDESFVELETDKASMELPAPAAGVIKQILKKEGEAVSIGDIIAYLEEGDGAAVSGKGSKAKGKDSQAERTRGPEKEAPAPSEKSRPAESSKKSEGGKKADTAKKSSTESVAVTPSARRALLEHGLSPDEVPASGKRLRREDVVRHVEQQKDEDKPSKPAGEQTPNFDRASVPEGADQALEEVVPMTLIRRRIAARLVEAQHTAALLTTFNEIDMSSVLELRKEYGERFLAQYGVKLGFMSFFVKAVVDAMKETPVVNAEVRGTDIVYRNFFHIGIAIGGGRGLVVPVLRHAERMSFGEIEQAIADFAVRAKANKLGPEELTGGTFTISNGGIYGSLLSTPIVNPPQSGVLGMHSIQERPVARDGQVVIRPMMYVALTYDHRIVDGREAVTFLKRLKEAVEAPLRMLLET